MYKVFKERMERLKF